MSEKMQSPCQHHAHLPKSPGPEPAIRLLKNSPRRVGMKTVTKSARGRPCRNLGIRARLPQGWHPDRQQCAEKNHAKPQPEQPELFPAEEAAPKIYRRGPGRVGREHAHDPKR